MNPRNPQVNYVITNGDQKSTATSGSHFAEIYEVLKKHYQEMQQVCDSVADKHFGEGTGYEELQKRVIAAMNKPKEEQTDEDRNDAEKYLEKNKAYLAEAPHVRVTVGEGEKTDILLDCDLKSALQQTGMRLLDGKGVGKVITQAIFEVMRRSGVKLAAVILALDKDLTKTNNSSGSIVLASPFCDIEASDLHSIAGRMELVRDKTLPQIAEKLKIPMPPQGLGGPQIIMPSQANDLGVPQTAP